METTKTESGKLAGRVALITGAGRGIGRGVAVAMAKEGADIAIAELDPASAENAAKEIEGLGRRALSLPTDVRSAEACEAAVARTVAEFGRLDILVNNAAVDPKMVPLEQLDDDDFMLVFDVSAMATFRLMRAASPHLRASPAGRVINFASSSGTFGRELQFAYAAAKEAVRGMTRVAAREWGSSGVTVNSVCPLANSEGLQGYLDPAMRESILRAVPLADV